MAQSSKALDSLDKIIDLIWHEEGRLAIINRYGAYLSDEEKVQATQLITSQKANMDRLFTIYRDELLPLMHEVRRNSEAMDPLFDKLLTSAMMARQMNGEQNVTAENTVVEAVRSEETAMENGEALVNNFIPNEPTAEAGVVGDSAAPATDAVVSEGSEEVAVDAAATVDTPVATEGAGLESQFNLGDAAAATNAPVGDVPADTGVVAEDAVSTPVDNPLGSPVESVSTAEGGNGLAEGSSENAEVKLSSMEEEPATPFVLSPIDEDVAPAVTEEEAKKAEETIAAADQQLGAIDAVKTDIMASTELTEEEKVEKLEQYTRISDAAVKAILVTKAQCEKLLASRASQKALLSPAAEATAGASTAGDEVVAALPDFTASESEAVVALPSAEGENATEEKKEDGVVIPAIGGDTPVADAAPVAETANEGVVLPMIGGEAPVSDTPALSTDAPASDVVLEIPGATNDATADAQSSQNELQAMIEQANALYKEGKTAEAQALFEKIGAMNQGGNAAADVAEEAAVLVKK